MTTVHATTATQKTVDGPSNSMLHPTSGSCAYIQRTGEEDELLPPTSFLLLPEQPR